MVDRVKNKIALVTGAAQGLGKTMSELLIQEGAQVILTDINEDLLEKTATELDAPFKVLDVTEPEAWQNVIAEIEKDYGKLHVLINNAGIGAGGDHNSLATTNNSTIMLDQQFKVVFSCNPTNLEFANNFIFI